MEKINKFILKKPVLTSLLTFICALIFAIVVKSVFGLKNIDFEHFIYINVLSVAFSYGYYFKEPLLKSYKLKYSLIITLLCFGLDLFYVSFSSGVLNSQFKSIIYVSVFMPLLFMPFFIYYFSGYISKIFSKIDFKQQVIIEKNLPIETQKERKIASLALFVFMTLAIILFALNDKHIIHVDNNIIFAISILFLIVMFSASKYFKKTYGINFKASDEDKGR